VARPLDVRKGLPFRCSTHLSSEATPREARGVASKSLVFSLRKGRAFPHIKRQSRRLQARMSVRPLPEQASLLLVFQLDNEL
jgi:hypothetical protein